MIPAFDHAGQLPAGVHEAEWAEVVERFGRTKRRRTLLAGLGDALRLLRAAGCNAVYLGGSFVTAKPVPADFDAAWVTADVDVNLLDGVFFDFSDGRAAQKARFGGELFPADFEEADTGRSFAEFFQFSREDEPVGIVLIINLQTVP